MRSFNPRMYHDRRNASKRGLALGLGLAATLAGVLDVVGNISEEPGVPAVRESTTAPQDSGTPAPEDLGLRGTILSTRSAETRTIIADTHGRQRAYALGGEVPDRGKVVEIHRDYIILQHDGRLETLEFSWNVVVRMLERSTLVTHGAVHEMPPENEVDNLRDALFTHPELLLDLIGASPVLEGDRLLGYRVMEPEDPALLESLGLKPGDLLTAVNGVPFDSPDYGAQLLGAMSGTGKLTFTIRRAGQILVLSD